ncbi:MAG TPA: L-threonylcarbamoyladenylate synthase [Patescibacteria group bacterium]|nr:L-threonylcarbamoyladenylate synthase [Patescibacteria group bacterium]
MNDLQTAIKILNDGGIIIFPTDTAFGIGCRIDKDETIKRLFNIRKRPVNQATPVLVSSIEMAKEYVEEIPNDVQNLMKLYWPGALTIVLPCKTEKVPELVRGGGSTIGIRVPNHETTIELIKGVGVPILGPSANFHGEDTPYSVQQLNSELVKLVDFVLPGETKLKQASTVIDCSQNPWKILREGAVKIDL